MIDIHTHILPNIDDGSKSIEETFNLIKEAKSVGFDSIVQIHQKEKYGLMQYMRIWKQKI